MMILKKIIAMPLLAAPGLLSAFVSFLVCVVSAVGLVACVILVLLALLLLIFGQTAGTLVLLVLAFLVSPFGLPAVAEWVSDGLHALRNTIQRWV